MTLLLSAALLAGLLPGLSVVTAHICSGISCDVPCPDDGSIHVHAFCTSIGTPKNYCEDPSEWRIHTYGPVGDGHLIALGQDGNIAGDCNGDGVPADYDGHIEWAIGGGWLSAESGDGVTTGSIYCFGEVAHHPFFGPISVNDIVNGGTQAFFVASDFISLVPPTNTDNCGDFESDDSTPCVGPCTVTFPPGLDGTYQVYVGEAETGSIGVGGYIVSP